VLQLEKNSAGLFVLVNSFKFRFAFQPQQLLSSCVRCMLLVCFTVHTFKTIDMRQKLGQM